MESILALPPTGTSDEAFLREVDEEYRREQALRIARRYGRLIIAGVVVLLLALAAFLFWRHYQEGAAEKTGEQYDAALRTVDQGAPDKSIAAFDKVAAEGGEGYTAMAKIAQGNLLAQKNDLKAAAAKFAEVANDTGNAKPFRDLALIRQTATEFDALKPQVVIDRLKPMTEPNSPWLGSAGEMVAAAYLKAGNKAEAGKMFAQIAKGGDRVPPSLRQRAVQMAGVLGVDATDQSKDSKAQ